MSLATPSSSPPTTPISTSRMIFALDRLGQQLLGDLEVLVQLHRRAVPHVGLEQRVLPGVHALLADRDQRTDVGVELVLRAVVGVQRDVDRVLLGDDVRELGQGDGAGDHVLDRLARAELRAAGRDLDDAVALGLGEAAQRRVERLRGRAVDGRDRRRRCRLRPVQHLVVDLGGRDGHRRASQEFLDAVGAGRPTGGLARSMTQAGAPALGRRGVTRSSSPSGPVRAGRRLGPRG